MGNSGIRATPTADSSRNGRPPSIVRPRRLRPVRHLRLLKRIDRRIGPSRPATVRAGPAERLVPEGPAGIVRAVPASAPAEFFNASPLPKRLAPSDSFRDEGNPAQPVAATRGRFSVELPSVCRTASFALFLLISLFFLRVFRTRHNPLVNLGINRPFEYAFGVFELG